MMPDKECNEYDEKELQELSERATQCLLRQRGIARQAREKYINSLQEQFESLMSPLTVRTMARVRKETQSLDYPELRQPLMQTLAEVEQRSGPDMAEITQHYHTLGYPPKTGKMTMQEYYDDPTVKWVKVGNVSMPEEFMNCPFPTGDVYQQRLEFRADYEWMQSLTPEEWIAYEVGLVFGDMLLTNHEECRQWHLEPIRCRAWRMGRRDRMQWYRCYVSNDQDETTKAPQEQLVYEVSGYRLDQPQEIVTLYVPVPLYWKYLRTYVHNERTDVDNESWKDQAKQFLQAHIDRKKWENVPDEFYPPRFLDWQQLQQQVKDCTAQIMAETKKKPGEERDLSLHYFCQCLLKEWKHDIKAHDLSMEVRSTIDDSLLCVLEEYDRRCRQPAVEESIFADAT